MYEHTYNTGEGGYHEGQIYQDPVQLVDVNTLLSVRDGGQDIFEDIHSMEW